jgi:hypothetical protein
VLVVGFTEGRDNLVSCGTHSNSVEVLHNSFPAKLRRGVRKINGVRPLQACLHPGVMRAVPRDAVALAAASRKQEKATDWSKKPHIPVMSVPLNCCYRLFSLGFLVPGQLCQLNRSMQHRAIS